MEYEITKTTNKKNELDHWKKINKAELKYANYNISTRKNKILKEVYLLGAWNWDKNEIKTSSSTQTWTQNDNKRPK